MLRWLGAVCTAAAVLIPPSTALAQTDDPDQAGGQEETGDPLAGDSGETGLDKTGLESAASQMLDADVYTEIVVEPSSFSATVTLAYSLTNSSDLTHAAFFERLPPDAVLESVVMGGSLVLTVADESNADHTSLGMVFGTPLAPGATLEGLLSYTISFPGDVDGLRHVSPGLVAIAPFAAAHGSGAGRLTVRIPESFSLLSADGWEASSDGGYTVLEAVGPMPYEPVELVAESAGALARRSVSAAGLDIVVATLLPGTTAVAEVREVAEAVVELTGLGAARPVEIRHGWPGRVPIREIDDPLRSVSVVLPSAAPDVYAAVIARELLGAIEFADDTLLADTAWAVAARAAGQDAAGEPDAQDPDAQDPAAQGVAAGRWAVPLRSALERTEAPAAVFAALAGTGISYPGTAPAERHGAVDWRWMLDVIENRGGVQAAEDFAAAAGPEAAAQIRHRDEARLDYRHLEEHADGWSLPPYLRLPLAEWDFDEYRSRRDAVQEMLEARDELASAAASAGLGVGPHLRIAFESAQAGMHETQQLLSEQRLALDVVAEAQSLATTDRGLLAGIGLMDYDAEASLARILARWEAGDFGGAEREAHSLIATYEGAVGRGTLRAAVPLAVLAAVALAGRRLWRRQRRKAAGQSASSEP